jgi:thiol-disulfide isomerase/thioredoxin
MRLELVILFCICSIFCFSQEIKKNADGSVSIIADAMMYLDSNGNRIDEHSYQDSLKTGMYVVSFKEMRPNVEFQLKKKYPELLPLLLGKELPSIELTDINQNKINIGENSALTLLLFWDMTCKPCIEELIVFNILANEFPEVSFVALTSDPIFDVNKFIKEKGFKWENLIIVSDFQEYFEITKIHTYPINIIINDNRIVKRVFVGKRIREILVSLENLEKKEKGTVPNN